MLGIRLAKDIEARFEHFVRRRGLNKSDVGRAALVEYLDRHEFDAAEMKQQLAAIAEFERSNRQARDELADLADMAARMAHRDD
jgi:predicted transcriptional regulator